MQLKKMPKTKGIIIKNSSRQPKRTIYARLFIDLPVKNNVITVNLDAIERVTGEIRFVMLERENDSLSIPFPKINVKEIEDAIEEEKE